MKGFFFLLFTFCIITAKPQTSILFVGNSITYFNNLPEIFKDICLDNTINVNVKMVAFPGFSLNQHISGYIKKTNNPNFVYFNRISKNDTIKPELIKELYNKNWDYIYLQDRGLDEDSIEFALKRIKKLSPNSKLILFENYLPDSKWSKKYDRKKKRKNTKRAKYLAKQIDAEVLFISKYFEKIKNQKTKELLYDNTFHPTYFGSSVIAITLFQTISPKVKLNKKIKGINLTEKQWKILSKLKIL